MTRKFRKFSKRLVIDASVVYAAGDQTADHPTSTACRDFLLSVLAICHRAVLTSEIAQEWRRHASPFSSEWLAAMVSRRKAVHVSTESGAGIEEAISSSGESPSGQTAMRKDRHLIDAALATDRRIVSLDETARRQFGQLATAAANLRKIVWVNPDCAQEGPLVWLRSGARLEPRRKLGRRSAT